MLHGFTETGSFFVVINHKDQAVNRHGYGFIPNQLEALKQVGYATRDEAQATADVLNARNKGFHWINEYFEVKEVVFHTTLNFN